MSAIPPFTIEQESDRLWRVVDARMNIVGYGVDEEQAGAAANRLLREFKESKHGEPKPAQEPKPREETIDEIVELIRHHARFADESGTKTVVFLSPFLREAAARIEKAVRVERTRVQKELEKLVRVAHRCHECAKFRTERCWMKDGEPDAFRIACECFEKVWHRLTAEEASLCELQAAEINALRREVFQLKQAERKSKESGSVN